MPETIPAPRSWWCACGRRVATGAEVVEDFAGCAACDWGNGAALDPKPGMRARMGAAQRSASDFSLPWAARERHWIEAERLTRWWGRLSPEQVAAAIVKTC